MIVIDEASMLDLVLTNQLLHAIARTATCCWSATSTSCPPSAPATCCAT